MISVVVLVGVVVVVVLVFLFLRYCRVHYCRFQSLKLVSLMCVVGFRFILYIYYVTEWKHDGDIVTGMVDVRGRFTFIKSLTVRGQVGGSYRFLYLYTFNMHMKVQRFRGYICISETQERPRRYEKQKKIASKLRCDDFCHFFFFIPNLRLERVESKI